MFLVVVLVNYDDPGDTKVVIIQNIQASVFHSNKDWDVYCQAPKKIVYPKSSPYGLSTIFCHSEVLTLFERLTEIEVVVHS